MIWRYAYGDAEAHIFPSQYRIILAYWTTIIVSFAISFFVPLLAILAVLCFFGYLYLPLLQSKSINRINELWQVPLIKLTIITANTVGYIKGIARLKML